MPARQLGETRITGQQFVAALELLHRRGLVALCRERRMSLGHIRHHHAHVAVTGAVSVGIVSPFVERQFHLVFTDVVAQIHQRETGEVEPVALTHSQYVGIEAHRAIEIEHTDH